MDFGLTDEQLMMQDTVRSLLTKAAPPLAILERLDEHGNGDLLWGPLAELGLTALLTPEDVGGGFEILDAALVAEVGGEGALPGPLLGHQLATIAITRGGSDEQRARWLPELASGRVGATLAWAEHGDRWDPASWETTLSGDRVTGRKVHVPFGSSTGLLVVGVNGGLAVVELAADGVQVEPFDGIDRTRRLSEVTLTAAPATELPGAASAAEHVRDVGLVLLAADAFGAASRIMHETVEHVCEREQFGTKLAQFQGIKHELADMAVSLEPTRALWWYAAHALDRGLDDGPRVAALAKATIGDRAMAIARACVDLHGAIGFTWESPLHLWYKRIMFDRAFLGGSGHHRDRAAAMADWS